MDESIYQARKELFRSLNVPMSRADVRLLAWRQRMKLRMWEWALESLLLFKRLFDIVVAGTTLLLLSPLFAVLSAWIYLEDRGPVFFAQDRVGRNGRIFRFYKFRSMVVDAERLQRQLERENESGDGVIFKMARDPRVTRVGRILRRFSMDELPQFLNVLRGDLTLVGPRPPLPSEVAEYSLEERKRLHVTPGLTCLWQIKGRSEIPFKEQVRLDLEYIHSQSLWTDFVILLKTVPAVLLGRGAY